MINYLLNECLKNSFKDSDFKNYFEGNYTSPDVYTLIHDFAFNPTLEYFSFQQILLSCQLRFYKITIGANIVYI